MFWEHATVVTVNLFLLVIFQSLFFIFYANEMLVRKIRKEAKEFTKAMNTCSIVVPGSGLLKAQYLKKGKDEPEALKRAKEERKQKNAKIHNTLKYVAISIGSLLLLFTFLSYRTKQLSLKEISLIIGGSLLGYVSEVFFFFFVIQKYQFFTYKDFMYQFTRKL